MRPVAVQTVPTRGQTSLEARLDRQRGRHPRPAGRGRDRGAARRACGRLPDLGRMQAAALWSGFVTETCGTREACAVVFGVTFQAACNWFDGFSVPGGDHVLKGAAMFPQAFARLVDEVAP